LEQSDAGSVRVETGTLAIGDRDAEPFRLRFELGGRGSEFGRSLMLALDGGEVVSERGEPPDPDRGGRRFGIEAITLPAASSTISLIARYASDSVTQKKTIK
jgi:hypothetical protein